MEQRRLRLGDIVDDYCPRERRVTNHAVVAMVEEDVKQTRCTTCDTEHPYKGGKAPRRRKKDTTGALYKEVLAGLTDADAPPAAPALAPPVPPPVPATEPVALHAADAGNGNGHGSLQPHSVTPTEEPEPLAETSEAVPVEDGPVHRPLIRATLPRLEGHKEERKATDFTIRQSSGRGGQQFQNARGADQNRGRPRNTQGHGQGQPSNRPHGAGARFAGSRPGQQTRGASSGRPQGGGFRGGQAPGRTNSNGNANGNTAHGGGRKRSR